ncbi:MAG: zinc-binding dehydrogenase [Candidatus Binataceae bacterium]|nr:zinc-binding dehydrogenase [Candidatus Binataceae bacterium]
MKAARHHGSLPLQVEDISDPALRPGSVVVRVLRALIPSSVGDVLSSRYSTPDDPAQNLLILPPMPHTAGVDCIGVVEAVAADVSGLSIGDQVYCDPFLCSNHPAAPWDACLIGYMGFSPASRRLLQQWPDGPYAQKAVYPAQCVTPVGDARQIDPAILARLGYLGTCYGALIRSGIRPGQTLIINGATGILGVGAVMIALGMGIAKIVATGRKRDVLERLRNLNPKRVIPVALEGTLGDADRVADAAGGADVVLDCMVGLAKDAGPTMAAIRALRRPGGVAVLVGGVMTDLPLPYTDLAWAGVTVGVGSSRSAGTLSDPTGSLWFPRAHAADLLLMIGSGALDLDALSPEVYTLDKINDALEYSSSRRGGFNHVVVAPNDR